MDDKTFAALSLSVKKWRKLSWRFFKPPNNEEIGSKTCELCKIYDPVKTNCGGCPVYEKTKLSVCAGTPWKKCGEHLMYWRWEFPISTEGFKFRRNAKKMADFLQNILDEEIKRRLET